MNLYLCAQFVHHMPLLMNKIQFEYMIHTYVPFISLHIDLYYLLYDEISPVINFSTYIIGTCNKYLPCLNYKIAENSSSIYIYIGYKRK